MKLREEYTYNQDTGESIFTYYYKNIPFTGRAAAHPDDMAFANQNTGLNIAEARAAIKVNKFIRNFEIRPALEELIKLQNLYKARKYYKPELYENKILEHRIEELKNDWETTNNEIADAQRFLKDYISLKEKTYQKWRMVKDN